MELENKGSYGVIHIFEAKQGNRTIETVVDGTGKHTGPHYANEIKQGDRVKISGPNQVEKAGAGNAAIGIAFADFDHEGAIPKTAANWGSYTNNCYVRVETGAHVIKAVKLETTNSAISAGDKIKVGTTTPGCYDKETSSNNAIALEDASASSGAIIPVAFRVLAIIPPFAPPEKITFQKII